MNLKISNINYAATIVQLGEQLPVPNSDKLRGWRIGGEFVITNQESNSGEFKVYFPLECKINPEYLSLTNSFRHSYLNKDKNVVGYMEDNARVRAIRLRGNLSDGMLLPLESLGLLGIDYSQLKVGDTFNEIDGINICQKYVVKSTKPENVNSSKVKKKVKKEDRERLVENQFRFHIDTVHFARFINTFYPEDVVSITYKLHGTSGISSKLLIYSPKTWLDKFKGLFRISQRPSYQEVYASRKVIKSLNKDKKVHYYNEDIWGEANKILQKFIKNGFTFYYEIVGYLPNSTSQIQKGYDYGCKVGTFDIYIYRITQTSSEGVVTELSTLQLKEFCDSNGLKSVPLMYYGTLRNYLPLEDKESVEHWRIRLIDKLVEDYNNKSCYLCVNDVPEEGIVVRKENVHPESIYLTKLKSARFKDMETALLDQNVEDIEESQQPEDF